MLKMIHYTKLVLIGDCATGKSSFINRLFGLQVLINNGARSSEIETDYLTVVDGLDTCQTELIDIPSNRYNMILHHVKYCDACLLFCDYSRQLTFKDYVDWIKEINVDDGKLCYLIINKIDKELTDSSDDGEWDSLIDDMNCKFEQVFKISCQNLNTVH